MRDAHAYADRRCMVKGREKEWLDGRMQPCCVGKRKQRGREGEERRRKIKGERWLHRGWWESVRKAIRLFRAGAVRAPALTE